MKIEDYKITSVNITNFGLDPIEMTIPSGSIKPGHRSEPFFLSDENMSLMTSFNSDAFIRPSKRSGTKTVWGGNSSSFK